MKPYFIFDQEALRPDTSHMTETETAENNAETCFQQGRRQGGVVGVHDPPTFLRSKKKKEKPRQKRTIFKAETIERLSPRSKCYCFSHSRVSRIQKLFFSANHGGRQY